jgi:hypothetical protein
LLYRDIFSSVIIVMDQTLGGEADPSEDEGRRGDRRTPKRPGEIEEPRRPARTEEGATAGLSWSGCLGGDIRERRGLCDDLNVDADAAAFIIVGEKRWCGGVLSGG